MSEEHITATLRSVEAAVNDILQFTASSVTTVNISVRESCVRLKEETGVRISASETQLIRSAAVIAYDADYHLLRAYFHASPSLILIITAIYAFVKTVITVINTINSILKVITGETLAYWLNKLIPGFQDAWNDIMNKISEFSAILGWGVDGVNHLLNGFNASADLWSLVTGKDRSAAQMEKIRSMQTLAGSYSLSLKKWQDNPGEQISAHADMWSKMKYSEGAGFINEWIDKIGAVGDKAEKALSDIGTVGSELLALRSNMPDFIAKNIPQALWDAALYADTMINDRLLPALNSLSGRLDSLDKLLDSYAARAATLADKIAHPGDMLAEINKLADYARQDQLVKIDSVTSGLLRQQNEADFAAAEADMKNFAMVVEVLSHAPAPLAFMELELPGRSPGIVAEPRETWLVGDY